MSFAKIVTVGMLGAQIIVPAFEYKKHGVVADDELVVIVQPAPLAVSSYVYGRMDYSRQKMNQFAETKSQLVTLALNSA
jgi:hypothetical protein